VKTDLISTASALLRSWSPRQATLACRPRFWTPALTQGLTPHRWVLPLRASADARYLQYAQQPSMPLFPRSRLSICHSVWFFRCIVGVGKAIVFALSVGCPARPTATGGPVSPAVGPVLPRGQHCAGPSRGISDALQKNLPPVL
jgi:hypothetical protein